MKPKSNIITFNTPLATCWLEKKTLCISSNNIPRTHQNIHEHYQTLKGIIKKKVCWLLDFQTCQNFNKEVSASIDTELPTICSCIAIIAQTKCEKVSAETFMKFKEIGIPVKIFDREREARVWLRYLELERKKSEIEKNPST